MPPWLLAALALIIMFGSVAATRWSESRSLITKAPAPSESTAPKIPPILKVSIKILPINDSGRDQITLVIRNTGGSPALHIQLNDIHVFQTRIRFFDDIPLLAPSTATKPLKPFVVEFPDSKKRDMALAMYEATYGVQGNRSGEAYDYQGGATFYDDQGKKFAAGWIYTFYPFRYKRSQLSPDDDTPTEERGEVGPYLTVSDVGISEIPA
jgi:hypothetical protein